VKTAALSQALPFLPTGDEARLIPEGVPLPAGTEAVSVFSNTVSEDYFRTLDIPIIAGRDFAVTDRADSPRVAIVDEMFAHKYYPNQGPVGKRLRLHTAQGPILQIVGVARQSRYFFPVEPPLDWIYQPLQQNPQTGMALVLHTSVDSTELAAPLRQLMRTLDADQPIIGVRTMGEIFDMRARKTMGVLIEALAGLGGLGLLLALVGLYGLMNYSVSLRQREIGIRMAIGAAPRGVLRLVLRQGVRLGGIGVAIGLVLWLLASRPVMSLIAVRSFSWSLLTLVSAGLLAAAVVGAYIPARRASLVDPHMVLRQD
jgi:hypothetical protein